MEYLDYTKITHENIGEYGAYIIDDKLTLVLAQQAYIDDGFDTEPYYTALAYNLLDEEEEYRIKWTVRTDYMDDYLEAHGEEPEDERKIYFDFLSELFSGDDSSMCDFDEPSYIARY